ncbi:hypothetical protein ZWY2020_044719, partial [Hordeum vulgare]
WCSRGELHLFLRGPYPPGSHAAVLTSHRGLLVVLFVPQKDPYSTEYDKTKNLALYDPIAGQSRPLPELKSDRPFRIEGCALLTLLIIGADQDEAPRHNLHVFPSTGSSTSWSTPRECYGSLEVDTPVMSQHNSAVVCQGIAHWLFENTSNFYVLSVCAKTTEMSLTRLPVTPDQTQPRLGVTNDGTPCLLRFDGKCTMSGDSNTGRWQRTKMVEVQCLFVGQTSAKLLVKDNQQDMYIVDLQTGAMEAITNWFRGTVVAALPFEIDWPTFFTRRLANARIKRTKPGGVLS